MGLFDLWRQHRRWQKMIGEWREALHGPKRCEIMAMGAEEWARMKQQREREEHQLMESYSIKVFRLAAEGADAIRQLSEDRTVEQPKYGLDREWFPVFTMFHSFYLHITDREAFDRAGNLGRNHIMGQLVHHSIDVAVNSLLEAMSRDELPGIKKTCLEHLNYSNELYGQYKSICPNPGEPAEGTAVWRLGLEVARSAGRPESNAYVLKSQEYAVRGLSALDPGSYVAPFAQRFKEDVEQAAWKLIMPRP